MKPIIYLMACFVSWSFASASYAEIAGIVRTDGGIRLLSQAPRSVDLRALESDTEIFVFAERQGHVLRRDMPVDISAPGNYRNSRRPRDTRDWRILSPGFIPSGTKVDSYYFHFDNETYNETFTLKKYFDCDGQIGTWGEVTFARPVLGIAMRAYRGSEDHLGITNHELGLRDVTYCTHNFRHFPGVNIADGCGSDHFILSENRRTLWVRNVTDVHHDNYRVIVQSE